MNNPTAEDLSSDPVRSDPAHSDPADSDPADSDPAQSDPAQSDRAPSGRCATAHRPLHSSPGRNVRRISGGLIGAGVALLLTSLTSPVVGTAGADNGSPYLWPHAAEAETIEARIPAPRGFHRAPAAPGSFGSWLRGLPLLPQGTFVMLYNGLPKLNQLAHVAVVDVDVGTRDLQQCADAVIRMRAEYLFSQGCQPGIAFHFTNGDLAPWIRWRRGERPSIKGSRVSWEATGRVNGSYQNFQDYLRTVFTYAGSLSLEKEVLTVADPSRPEAGDLYIRGGSPGHAVLVVDIVENDRNERMFLLAQSYMPAQQLHVLRNPDSSDPWYPARSSGILRTPEWEFRYEDLRRFPEAKCGG